MAAQEDTLDALVKISAMAKEKPEILLAGKAGLKNAESLTKAIQTATLTQRDLYGMKNIDQKFVQKKWREEQKLQVQLKQMGLKEDKPEEDDVEIIYIHKPEEEGAADG